MIIEALAMLLANFIYAIIVGFVLFSGAEYLELTKKMAGNTYSGYLVLVYMTFFPVLIGLLLAVPNFISTARKPGIWGFDWIRFISVWLPAFYITIFTLLSFTSVGKYLPFGGYILSKNLIPHTVAGVVSGYLLLALFKKKSLFR
ncbi:MAG: hypothetical protein ACYC4H_11170 [Desulfocucumaceae bacterium]